MSNKLIETIEGYFDEPVVEKASSYLSESEETVRKSLSAAIPVTLYGIIRKAEKGDVETIDSMAKSALKTDILKHRINTFTSEGGGVPSYSPTMMTNLFADKVGKIQNLVSTFVGSKGTTAASVFGTAVPVTLAAIGKHASENGLSPAALSAWLLGQKSEILAAFPAGFSLGTLLDDPIKVTTPPVMAAPVVEEKKKNTWLWLLLFLLLALLLWMMLRNKGDEAAAPAVTHDTVVVQDTLVVEKLPVKLTLPNGKVIEAYKGSIEDLLIAFIQDPNAKTGNDNWFDFTDLNFNTGTAEIIPETKKELDNIIEILRAFPKVKVKLGGYTDKVGDAAVNKKLSLERAKAVAKAITDAGLGQQVTGAEGYGYEFAKYPESAPEADRVKDRHVSVSVREK